LAGHGNVGGSEKRPKRERGEGRSHREQDDGGRVEKLGQNWGKTEKEIGLCLGKEVTSYESWGEE